MINSSSHDTITHYKSSESQDLRYSLFQGIIQRMLLLIPDKAELRSATCYSTVALMDSLYESHYLSTLQAIIAFILQLYSATKVHHRSVSIDISAALLQGEWIWNLQAHDKDVSFAYDLFVSILRRCYDVAPSIRLRALTAISSLLVKALESRDQLHKLISDQLQNPTLEDQSLVDVVRESCLDDRPLVRAKAIAVLEILSLNYSEQAPHDDLDILAEACGDKSLAVRKQALASIIALTLPNGQTGSLVEIFIEAALPRVLDAVCHSFNLSIHQIITVYYRRKQRYKGNSLRHFQKCYLMMLSTGITRRDKAMLIMIIFIMIII